MDDMQDYEVDVMIKNLQITQKQEWNKSRYIMWASLKPYLKKKHTTPEDILPLPWDEKKNSSTHTERKTTDDDINALRKLMMKKEP